MQTVEQEEAKLKETEVEIRMEKQKVEQELAEVSQMKMELQRELARVRSQQRKADTSSGFVVSPVGSQPSSVVSSSLPNKSSEVSSMRSSTRSTSPIVANDPSRSSVANGELPLHLQFSATNQLTIGKLAQQQQQMFNTKLSKLALKGDNKVSKEQKNKMGRLATGSNGSSVTLGASTGSSTSSSSKKF